MGKDREGTFHPKKGKPSGSMKESDQEIEIELEEIAAPLRHPNRNVNKGEEVYQGKKTPVNKASEEVMEIEKSSVSVSSLSFLSKDLLKELATQRSEPCISIYIPTYRLGEDQNEKKNEITWKSALKKTEQELEDRDMDKEQAIELLQPAYETLQSLEFDQEMSHGLALFIAKGFASFIQLPFIPEESITISSTFELAPILPVWPSPHFYLLTLSKKQAKLFRGDQFNVTPIPLADMPNGVEDVVHLEEKEGQELFRTGSSGAGGGANYHGMGAGQPDDKKNIALYFEDVDKTIRKQVLGTENAPLLLAGVEYLLPIYKQVSSYPAICSEGIIGNHDHETRAKLFELSHEKMQPYFKEAAAKAADIYKNHLGNNLAISKDAEIVLAAREGRIRYLFIRPAQHVWGTLDETSNKVTIHEKRQAGDECLINYSSVQTWLTGGEVLPLEDDNIQDKHMVALLRY